MRLLFVVCFLVAAFGPASGQKKLKHYLTKGDSLFWADEFKQSILYFDSLKLLAKQRSDLIAYIHALYGLGRAFRWDYSNPDYEKSFGYFNQGLALIRKIEKSEKGLDFEHSNGAYPIIPLMLKAEIFYSMLNTERVRIHYDKAMTYGSLTLQYAQQLEDLDFLAKSHNAMGNLYRDKGEHDLAMEQYGLAIRYKGLSRDQKHLYLYYDNLAITQSKVGLFEESLRNNQRTLDLIEKHYPDYNSTKGSIYQDMAVSLLELGDGRRARKYYELALAIEANEGQSGTYYKWLEGRMHFQFERYRKAISSFQQAFNSEVSTFKLEEANDSPLFEIVDDLGKTFLALYKRDGDISWLYEGKQIYEFADSLMISLRLILQEEESSLHMAAHFREFYDRGLTLLYEIKKTDQSAGMEEIVFQFMERSKQVILVRNHILNNRKGKEEMMHRAIKPIQMQIDEVSLKLADENKWALRLNHIDSLTSELIDLYQTRHQMLDSPGEFHSLRTMFPGLVDLQDQLDRDQLLLEYFWGTDNLFGIVIFKDYSKMFSIAIDSALVSAIYNIRKNISSFDGSDHTEDLQRFHDNSVFLYNRLLSDALSKNDLHKTKSAIFIPDGLLNYIPFTVLIASPSELTLRADYKQFDYLLNYLSISHNFSSAFVLAESVVHLDNKKLIGFSSKALTGTINELKTIEKIWGENVQLFLQDGSTEENFKNHVSDYEIIHIASHAEAGETNRFPSIQFDDDSLSTEDGRLYTYEVYPLKLPGSLTVLSACETTLGPHHSGEGIYSLARSFFYAGSHCVVTSLWKINDIKTVDLISAFYDNLDHDRRVSDALRSAQLTVLADGDRLTSHPYFWASFITVGDSKIYLEQSSIAPYLITAITMLFLIFLFFRFR